MVKARLAKGPAWECNKAWLAGGIAAWSSLYIAVWTGVVALFASWRRPCSTAS